MINGFENILTSGELKMFPFVQTNDPLEYNHRFIGSVDTYRGKHEGRDLTNERLCIEHKLLYDAFFLSTCQNGVSVDKKGYKKLRMWSQYGDSHKGLCFCLSKQKIIKYIENKYSSTCCFYHKNITYNHKMSEIYQNAILKGFLSQKTDVEGFSIEYITKEKNHLFFKKVNDYRDEKEYRFVLMRKESDDLCPKLNLHEILTAVIIGDKQNKNYLSAYQRFKTIYNVPFYRLKWFGGNIEVEDI